MATSITPDLLVLPLGGTGSFTVYAPGQAGAITATANSALVTVTGSGNAPGPVAFTVTDLGLAPATSIISIAIAGDPADSGAVVPVAVYRDDTLVQTGRTQAQAIATVRRRTNANFGQPSDTDILAMLNDGIEQVSGFLEPVLTSSGIDIIVPNTNLVAFPRNVERVRDVNFSTLNPAAPGAVLYEMVQMDYDVFIQNTDSSPAGGIGGIPTIYALIRDQNGVLTAQFYPYASSGRINFHYYKRPTLWTSTPTSSTDLDSLWQEAVLLYACSQVCEYSEDTGTAKYYFELYEKKIESNRTAQKRRQRKQGVNAVRDVSMEESVIPAWTR